MNPTDFLPPLAPWQGRSQALIAHAGDPWITPSETTDLQDTPSYADTISYLERLCAATDFFHLKEFGRTAEGRPLYAVIASLPGRGPAAAPVPLVYVQAGIHPGEIEGKDAGLMLLRDIAFRGKKSLLEHLNLLFVPVLNPDGHERISVWNRANQRGPVNMGWRTTAQNLNLNRDFAKADSPEIQAWLRLMQAHRPSLFIDVHASDGIDHAYDLTYIYNGYGGTFAYSQRSAAWLDHHLRPAVDEALRDQGHIPGPYLDPVDKRNLAAGFRRNHFGPRYSNGYGDVAHIPTVLIETHSLKPHRQRVLASYVFLEASLRCAGRERDSLSAAIAADEAARLLQLPVDWTGVGSTSRFDYEGMAWTTYLSPASGIHEVRWLVQPQWLRQIPLIDDAPAVQLDRPKAYWVPASRPVVIERLRFHGIRMETLIDTRAITVDLVRLQNPAVAPESFEGRQMVRAATVAESQIVTFPPGSVRVVTDQPLGDLAMILLDPRSDDSFFAWGFFNEILQQTEYIEGYVIAPYAEHVLRTDPTVKATFEAKLRAEPDFAADPEARLRWFYQRSPFFDQRHLLYPVGMEK